MTPKHYETRLQHDLDGIRARVSKVSEAAREAVDEAVRGLVAFEKGRMYQVILDDHPINRETRAIDRACHVFVAQHLPAAGHLRFVSSVLRLTIAIERIGDYAVTISRIGVQHSRPLPSAVIERIQAITVQSLRMLELASKAFDKGDSELAADTKRMAKKIDIVHDQAFSDFIADDDDRPTLETFGVLTILAQIERVSDQAKNICEEAIFVTTGQSKEPKTYRVLFLDADDGLLAPLGDALARQSFPNSGRFSSAGLADRPDFDPRLDGVAGRLAIDIHKGNPTMLEPLRPAPAEFHVIVAINIDEAAIGTIPFNTILLHWSIDPGSDDAALDGAARELNASIRTLMETLRGDSAS